MGQLTSQTDPLGRQQTLTYATNGIDLTSVHQTTGTLHDQLLTLANYTSQHRPQTITDAAGQTWTATYNSYGQLLTVTDPKSETTTFAYDANGYLQSVTAAIVGATTTFTYDSFGRQRTVTGSDGYVITTDYDALDRPTRTTYPDGTSNRIIYDKLNIDQRIDRAGRITRFFHDPLQRLTARLDPLGRTTALQWCTCGTLDKLIDGKGQSTTWQRDAQNRIVQEVRADGTTATTYSYENSTSRLKTVTDPKGQTRTYSYNADGSVSQVAYSNAQNATPSVSLTYDSNYKRVSSMTDGTGLTTYSYN
jgi:YD repeat-containing protein